MEKRILQRPAFRICNWCLVAAITAFILLTYYGMNNIPSTIIEILSEPTPSTITPDIPIKVTISQVSTAPLSYVALKITIENTSPIHPLHFLRWASPLDPHAAAVGVFVFTSTETAERAPSIDLKINHKLPDPGHFSPEDEDIIRIKAGGNVEKEVEVKDHEIQLKKGETYRVKARGRWMGVWIGEHEEMSFGESSDVRTGVFESESIEITVPS